MPFSDQIAATGAFPGDSSRTPWSIVNDMGMGVKSQQQLNRQFNALDGVSQALAAALQVREQVSTAAECMQCM